ncbi:MAG: hypothetical protein U1E62_26590 [Alsobacter sp.]
MRDAHEQIRRDREAKPKSIGEQAAEGLSEAVQESRERTNEPAKPTRRR